ncbi:neutral/alkaline non-lysosomal ceramidase N-terminal domain-containing protein [Lacihabitans soyangensis]|uniref:Alkaline ceramidase n=1 Tax=Lacihabitans soyangensis TaxID=869394 RepID=A0AAE3KSL6_9BACT|nr:neutral/alkaline non-lysosomal ceramidase N-terminal domain-containing protein [Lacihabitans soyangensis]MCP9763238.1 alkaline ceramidase [Lacihabitans soyangensis]
MKKIFLVFLVQLFFQQIIAQNLKVGASSAIINPQIGAYIAGDKQDRKFTGIHDNLYAKAVVISHNNSNVAIVTIDCIGLLYTDVLKIRKKTSEICKMPADRIVISSTHTHAGPDVVGIWGEDYSASGVDDEYMQFLINTTANQIKKAFENQISAKAYTAETTFGEPWVQNICNEELDRSLNIIQFRNSKNKAIATLSNFACHPTFMDAVASEVSADFIHGYYEELKKTTGGEVLFLQGAIGGWVQPENEPKTFENAYKRGKELAEKVNMVLKTAIPLKKSVLVFRSKKIKIPVENEAWQQLAALGTIKRNFAETVETEISFFKIGEAQFVTHPGETAPFYSLESKKMMKNGPKFILGLGNDALGYILKPAYFENPSLPHAEYLTRMSVGKQTGPIVLETVKVLVQD